MQSNQAKFNRGIAIPLAILIVVVLAVVVGGIVIWQQKELEKVEKGITIPEIKLEEKTTKEESKEESKEIIEDKSGEITKNEIAKWETYRDEKYGFEIKYPQNWGHHNLSPIGGVFRIGFWDKNCPMECGSVEINIKERNNKSFQQVKEETENKSTSFFLPIAFPFKETKIDNEPAFIIPGYEFILGKVIVAHGEYIYGISRVYSEEDVPEKLFNKILSIFRFLE